MHVKWAGPNDYALDLLIDGHQVSSGSNYTILEMGYAVLMADDPNARRWLRRIGEIIPADSDAGRPASHSSDRMAVTSDPVVVALC